MCYKLIVAGTVFGIEYTSSSLKGIYYVISIIPLCGMIFA